MIPVGRVAIGQTTTASDLLGGRSRVGGDILAAPIAGGRAAMSFVSRYRRRSTGQSRRSSGTATASGHLGGGPLREDGRRGRRWGVPRAASVGRSPGATRVSPRQSCGRPASRRSKVASPHRPVTRPVTPRRPMSRSTRSNRDGVRDRGSHHRPAVARSPQGPDLLLAGRVGRLHLVVPVRAIAEDASRLVGERTESGGRIDLGTRLRVSVDRLHR